QTQQQLFSNFAELDIWFKNIDSMIDFCFAAMPSSVEILEPTSFNLNASELTAMLNLLQTRVHEADMVVKNERIQYKALDKNSLTVFRNFIRFLLMEGPKTIDELSAPTGVTSDHIRPFLDRLVDAKVIDVDENNKYYLVKK
ncbi:MAG: hypothetical protein Q7K43_00650, partial [Candidatus Woesearchaeota archaeon]|nr:hypothetical protein [Candidatus Woesearchaeota archaeon]